MAITDQEKQDIIDGLLDVIRANGLDYSGNPITFPDAFNITQTERQNVKIPAIDERSSTPVHGNVDLEALLTAYGVTHVEEIASDIASNYMKKTADSNLNMNGYTNQNISSDTVYADFGSTRDIVHMPRIVHTQLGVDGTDLQAFFKAYFTKMVELFPNRSSIHFSGVITSDQIYYIDGYVNSTYAHNLDSEGVPLRLSFSLYSYMLKEPYYWYRGTSGDFVQMTIPTFPYGNTTKDNRINAMGWNYIRYENGLQIYWGNVYGTERPCHATFSPPFTEVFYTNATGSGATNFMYFGATANVTTTGMDIYRFSISTNSNIFEANNNGARIEYLVIGKWK